MDQLDIQWGPPVRIRIGRGPRATERLLLTDLEELIGEIGDEVLRRPVALVVPSSGLRTHLLTRLLSMRSLGIAGIECVTHHRLAARLVERSGATATDGPDLYPLFARRLAQTEPALARSLDHLQDGYRAILPAIGDLLDAGLDPAHHEALEEVLEQEGGAVAETRVLARAHAIVRVAVSTAAAMRAHGLERSSTLLARAAEIVKAREARPHSTVLVYGYSDATGVATDFLQALLETFGGVVYLDQPPDPARPSEIDAGITFSRRFTERLTALGSTEASEETIEAPRMEMFRALGGDAEVREVGRRIRTLLDAGQRPEGIAVVARTLESYRGSIRTHFSRLGIPFSAIGAKAPPHPDAYRAEAVLDLLRLRERAPVERWIEARAGSALSCAGYDLRLAYHSLGAGRLQDAAALAVDEVTSRGRLRLPAAARLTVLPPREERAPDTPPRPVVRRRKLEASALAEDVERCKNLLSVLDAAASDTVGHHSRRLEQLIVKELGYDADEGLGAELLSRARRPLALLPDEFRLEWQEMLEILRQAWAEIGLEPLGGNGGGVQVLDVIEARATTFDHLFVLGLNRGSFPRSVHEDPVLSDAMRRILGRSGFGVLPDLAIKRDGLAEERFLFAQLLAASPNVILSWQEIDDEHNFKTPSPLVERLRWASLEPVDDWSEPPRVDSIFSVRPGPESKDVPRTAYESAVLAGLFGDRRRRRFRDAVEVALADAATRDSTPGSPSSLANVRTAIIDEVDPSRWTTPGRKAFGRLGPFLGLVGQPLAPEDPRGAPDVSITTLERLATCPWRSFLERVLRVEPTPDPLELLPTLDARLIGSLVHSVLERIASDATGDPPKDLREAVDRRGIPVPWPSEDELHRLLERSASTLVRRQGIALPGFDRVLARFAGAYLESARSLDWPDGVSRHGVVAAEFSTILTLGADAPAISFRADRLDRTEDGLLLTDYKTGKRLMGRNHSSLSPLTLRYSVATGEALQVVAYALAGEKEGARGRYLYLHPEIAESKDPEIAVSASDAKTVAAFRHAAGVALDAWGSGAFFPRLTRPRENREPDACKRCDMAQACVRGDSGARSRLRLWNEAIDAGDARPSDAAHEAVAALWHLPLGEGS